MSKIEVTTRYVGLANDRDEALVLAVEFASYPAVGPESRTEINPKWVFPADPGFTGEPSLVYEVAVTGTLLIDHHSDLHEKVVKDE